MRLYATVVDGVEVPRIEFRRSGNLAEKFMCSATLSLGPEMNEFYIKSKAGMTVAETIYVAKYVEFINELLLVHPSNTSDFSSCAYGNFRNLLKLTVAELEHSQQG